MVSVGYVKMESRLILKITKNKLALGDWVLLDEINLASAETLECLSGLLESQQGSIFLLERGDRHPIARHPEFRLFAAMNPATDIGKKQLPTGLRSRFTELVVDEISSPQDLTTLVGDYLRELNLTSNQVMFHFFPSQIYSLHKLSIESWPAVASISL